MRLKVLLCGKFLPSAKCWPHLQAFTLILILLYFCLLTFITFIFFPWADAIWCHSCDCLEADYWLVFLCLLYCRPICFMYLHISVWRAGKSSCSADWVTLCSHSFKIFLAVYNFLTWFESFWWQLSSALITALITRMLYFV